MNQINEIYQKQLIYIFKKEQCVDLTADYLVIIKDDSPIIPIANCVIMHYQDDFESTLKIKLPTKMRKTKQLLSYQEACSIIEKQNYGVLSIICDGMPYSVGLNHIVLDGRIFFHCSMSGFKLNGINQPATFLVVEDLGINLEVGTHNHCSTALFGILRQVSDLSTKKAALLKIVADLAPKHPYNDHMLTFTNILELEVNYMIGKTHIR